jgi:CheY-like chemotaxis protein
MSKSIPELGMAGCTDRAAPDLWAICLPLEGKVLKDHAGAALFGSRVVLERFEVSPTYICRTAREIRIFSGTDLAWISLVGREPYRIIVVEDHASTAEALRKFLTTIGYKVYIAPDIASARGLAKAIEFDVLLSDLRLPDGTGWDLMKELSATKPVRAIAISGHNTDIDIERSRKVGFLDHIAKPLVAEQLTAAIERAVKKPRPTGARR